MAGFVSRFAVVLWKRNDNLGGHDIVRACQMLDSSVMDLMVTSNARTLRVRAMKLPHADEVLIEPEKLRDYLLSPTHPVGRFKAAYFAQFGYTHDNWERFAADLRRVASQGEVVQGKFSRFGNKYEIPATLVGPAGFPVSIVTVWIVRHGEDVPRFVTATPGDKS